MWWSLITFKQIWTFDEDYWLLINTLGHKVVTLNIIQGHKKIKKKI